jgi:YD repeat-containing protein
MRRTRDTQCAGSTSGRDLNGAPASVHFRDMSIHGNASRRRNVGHISDDEGTVIAEVHEHHGTWWLEYEGEHYRLSAASVLAATSEGLGFIAHRLTSDSDALTL